MWLKIRIKILTVYTKKRESVGCFSRQQQLQQPLAFIMAQKIRKETFFFPISIFFANYKKKLEISQARRPSWQQQQQQQVALQSLSLGKIEEDSKKSFELKGEREKERKLFNVSERNSIRATYTTVHCYSRKKR